MSIDSRWIPLAVLLSAAASWAVAQHYNLKSGGFVGAAYVGMFMADPYQVVIAFTIAIVTFLIVRYGLMRVLILFGRRKFSAMLLTSSMISWTLLWFGPSFLSARVTNHLDLASMALTPLFVPGLLANDMDRTSPLRVVTGAGLAAAFVVPTTWWIQSIVEGTSLQFAWMALSMATFVTIFWKSMRQLYRHFRPAKVGDPVHEDLDDDYTSDVEESDPQPSLTIVEEPVLVGTGEELTWPFVERRKTGRPVGKSTRGQDSRRPVGARLGGSGAERLLRSIPQRGAPRATCAGNWPIQMHGTRPTAGWPTR